MMTKRLWKYFVLATAVMLISAACSSGGDETATEQVEAATTAPTGVVADSGDDSAAAENSDGGDTEPSSANGEIPSDVPFPVPPGGNVFNYLDDPSEPRIEMRYDGDRFDEIVAFYADWLAGEPSGTGIRTDTEILTMFTVNIDGGFGDTATVHAAPTGYVTIVVLDWSRSG